MNVQTRVAIGRFKSGKFTAAEMSHLRECTHALYPREDYAKDSRTLRHAYNGDQEGRMRTVLSKRYPRTHWRMPVNTQNIVAETAELGAQVYRQKPARESGDGALVDLIDESPLFHASLLEVERISYVSGTAFLLVDVVDGKAEGTPVWAHQVLAIVDESRPWDLSMAHVVALQVAGEGTDLPALDDSFAVWVRSPAGWDVYSFTKTAATLTGTVPRLPLVCLRLRPSSSLFAPLARDLLLLQDQVNVTLSDHHHRFSLQAHRQLVASGPRDTKGQEQTIGPDSIVTFPQDTTVTQLSENDSTTAFDVVSSMLVLHARGLRQPIEAWHTKGGNPESGESRKIKNEWSDQKREEHVTVIVDFEARWSQALASLVGMDASVVATFPPPVVYESESAKTDRVLKLLGAGLIDDDAARKMLGVEAHSKGLAPEAPDAQGETLM